MARDIAERPTHVLAAIDADPHRQGSVDRALLTAAVPLTATSQATLYQSPAPPADAVQRSRPELERLAAILAADTIHEFQRATALRRWVAAVPRTFPEGGRATRDGFWGDFGTFLCGGTEEEVIKKGSPLAAELGRVLVALAGLAGLSARLVFLFAAEPLVRHTVVEIFAAGRWSVFDPVSDRSYAWAKHGFASAWELRRLPQLLDGLQDHGRLPYVDSRFYQTAAIAPYDPWDPAFAYPWDPLDAATAARLRAGEAS